MNADHWVSAEGILPFDLVNRADDPLALREIRAKLDPQPDGRRVWKDLAILKANGLAIPSGHGRGARWRSL